MAEVTKSLAPTNLLAAEVPWALGSSVGGVLASTALVVVAASLLSRLTSGRPHARARIPRGGWLALAAAGLAFLALASPLATLADGDLFAAHMLQHLLLLLVVPLLSVMALPRRATEQVLQRPMLRPAATLLSIAPVGWLAGVGAMWVWHQPAACTAALISPTLGVVRDLSFLAAGVLFWWPIAGPVASHRIDGPLGVAYLVSACIGCTVLGVAVTFAPTSPCPVFAGGAQTSSAFVESLRSRGFSPRIDQQTGGLLMWVGPCLLYIAATSAVLRRWYAAPSPIGDPIGNPVGNPVGDPFREQTP